jgi:hypothetical protein
MDDGEETRLLAEMMVGEAPFVDPRPFRAERF